MFTAVFGLFGLVFSVGGACLGLCGASLCVGGSGREGGPVPLQALHAKLESRSLCEAGGVGW
jgi:hypothetical protein